MDLFSVSFVLFLGITLVIFFLCGLLNQKAHRPILPQWIVLLVASLVFYGFVNVMSLVYIVLSSLLTWFIGYLVQNKLFRPEREYLEGGGSEIVQILDPVYLPDHAERRRYENFLTALSIIANVAVLVVLKYYGFLIVNLNGLFHSDLPLYDFLIPLGLSFYTFTLIGYAVDVNRRQVVAEPHFFRFLLFVSYFPKVMQGPISSYDRLAKDGLFMEHRFNDVSFRPAFLRLAIGLLKKVAIADVIGLFVDLIYLHYLELNGAVLFLGTLLYAIQLYCDFSGFMDIVIGLSGLFGIPLEENFRTPYLSSSIREFWKRWHITLGEWLKKYLYIPLGGNRVPLWRWMLNILIVWFVSGLWHGANWTFIVWGLYYGLLLILSRLLRPLRSKAAHAIGLDRVPLLSRILSICWTFLLVDLGWVFFRAPSIAVAGGYLLGLFRYPKVTFDLIKAFPLSFGYLFVAGFLLLLLVLSRIIISKRDWIRERFHYPTLLKRFTHYTVICLAVSFSLYMIFCFNSISSGNDSSFIYFDF